jgi:short subunit dehydrogenase-like uncharacterized protein
MPTQKTTARPYDLVLFGATGFTGELTATYLAEHAPADLRWALAGRNADKLAHVRTRLSALNPRCKNLPLLIVDASDDTALRHLAAKTRAVISTVGPYLKYGEPLVAACAAAGTDYVDLTGEPEFVDRCWLSYHELAKKTGARIVHCCGFDSIPHDLGAYFTVQQLPTDAPIHIDGFVRAGGTISGGTYHSALNAFSRLRQSGEVARQRRERETQPPFHKPGRHIGAANERPHRITLQGKTAWAVPMPTIDGQIVRRSAAAMARYGRHFAYGHYMLVGSLPKVVAVAGGVGALLIGAQFRLTRLALLRLKSPGDGPSEEARDKAWFSVRFVGTSGSHRVLTEVSGGDPGYGETSRMLAESALCLLYDDLPGKGGVLTPAQAMGNALINRLQAIGIRFAVIEKE